MFPKKISRFPPNHEDEFGIEVYSGTTLVSIFPYCMMLKELKELKNSIARPSRSRLYIALRSSRAICKKERWIDATLY